MKHGWAALLCVLALTAFVPEAAEAQAGPPGGSPERGVGVELGQNYPNPFNPETKIPFAISGPTCTEGRVYRVTMRIYNVLAQPVAVPILQGEGAPPSQAGLRMENLLLPCGSYTAYWNGLNERTSREVASGIYVYVIEVDGANFAKKMFVSK